jgi:hypothetical protein
VTLHSSQRAATAPPDAAGSASVPAVVCHYAAYLRTWLDVTPETSVSGHRAELRLRLGRKVLVVVFGCRKRSWSLRRIEIRRGEQTATFSRSEMDKAIASLLGQEPGAPSPQAPRANPRPQTDSTLRERRNTVIRT